MIRPLGSFLPTSADGFIVNDCSLDGFPDDWRGLLPQVVRWYEEALGSDLHSVWLRGSSVRSGVVPGVSDLDTLALARRPAERGGLWVRLSGAEAAAADLIRDVPSCPELELDVAALDVGLHEARGALLRFLLSTQALCIWGEPPTLPRFRPDASVRFLLPDIPDILAEVRRDLPVDDDVASLARWTGKLLVRAGLELVIARERRYARDLWPCYQAFARHEPLQADAMYRALLLAVEAPRDPERVQEVVDGIGTWLAERASAGP